MISTHPLKKYELHKAPRVHFKRQSQDPLNHASDNDATSAMADRTIERPPDFLNSIEGRSHWKCENECYICRKRLEFPYDEGLLCANRLFVDCSYVVCRECFVIDSSVVEFVEDFLEKRAAGSWICYHCSGRPRKRDINNNNNNNKKKKSKRKKKTRKLSTGRTPTVRTSGREQKVKFSFDCTFTGWGDSRVKAIFERCGRDGKPIEPQINKNGVRGLMIEEGGKTFWKCNINLGVGLYYVKMMVGTVHKAGCALHVWPNDMNAGSESNGRVELSWEVGTSTGTAIPRSLGGQPISQNKSSRTQGYNWKAEKKHAIQQYRPVITGHVPAQSPTIITSNSNPVVPENCRIPGIDSNAELYDRVMRVEGRTIEEYEVELNGKMFEKMMSSQWALVVGRSNVHGSGLFTLSGYGKGDMIAAYGGEIIRSNVGDTLQKKYDAEKVGTYFFRVNDEFIVDGTKKGNQTRFINHSCDPNIISEIIHLPGREFPEVVFKADRPIPPFSELTLNYMFPLEKGGKKIPCLCESWACDGFMS